MKVHSKLAILGLCLSIVGGHALAKGTGGGVPLGTTLVQDNIAMLGAIRGEVNTYNHPVSVNLDAWTQLNQVYFNTMHKNTGINPTAPSFPASITGAQLNEMAQMDERVPGNGNGPAQTNHVIIVNLYIELVNNRI